jgi:pyruvate carboxylase
MYPKVFTEFAGTVRKYGPVSCLPTPAFFYGMKPGDEVHFDIEKGKGLVIILQAIADPDDEGMVKVFFELNGWPRIVKVPNRSVTPKTVARRKAEEGNDAHVGSPMPGTISTIAVTTGQEVKVGDVLLTIEAMKMETALHATRAGTVAEVLVGPGSQIDAKDLLVVLA